MAGFSTYPTLLPRLQVEWGLSNTEAGFLSGLFFAGYMAAVPLLTTLTDRVDARRIYFVSSIVAAAGSLAFGLLAQGAAGAVLAQLLVGVGIAGTYMPGLRALTDNLSGPAQSRGISFYTAFFGVGISLSVLLAGWIAAALDWRWAFGLSALGPLVAAAMIVLGLPARRPAQVAHASQRLFDFRPVLRNRDARRYIFGYAVHCWELFGSRSWMVAFLTFAQGFTGAGLLSPIAMTAVANLASPVSSIVGNEWSLRAGRARVIAIGMAVSGALTCALGFLAGAPWVVVFIVLLLHMVLVMSDSSTLTAGMVAAADPALRGATMAVHSTLGFAAGFIAPLIFGLALDSCGGETSAVAWGWAFVTLGAGGLIAPMLLGFAHRR